MLARLWGRRKPNDLSIFNYTVRKSEKLTMIPHENSPVYAAGAKLENASAAMILLHGRGASAQDILSLASHLDFPGIAYLAPQAEGFIWYPNRLIAPVESNEPYLSAAIAKIDRLVKQVEASGIPAEKIFIGGFSQGASLSSEFVIRNPRPYGGLLVFSGGYIWQSGKPRETSGDLGGMPVFIGCSNVDPFIPLERVKETSALLASMNANVTEQIYPNMDHTIIDEEIDLARQLLERWL
ncbi:MAG TPA: dienelactone hydrolase family protein [Anaerolineales bacterium]|nr:dienelactone hydrolase family protein [Anaerolineales bacterium]